MITPEVRRRRTKARAGAARADPSLHACTDGAQAAHHVDCSLPEALDPPVRLLMVLQILEGEESRQSRPFSRHSRPQEAGGEGEQSTLTHTHTRARHHPRAVMASLNAASTATRTTTTSGASRSSTQQLPAIPAKAQQLRQPVAFRSASPFAPRPAAVRRSQAVVCQAAAAAPAAPTTQAPAQTKVRVASRGVRQGVQLGDRIGGVRSPSVSAFTLSACVVGDLRDALLRAAKWLTSCCCTVLHGAH